MRPGPIPVEDHEWIERLRSMSTDERAERVAQAVALAEATLAQHPDQERIVAWQEPIPASSIALLARLRARYRGPTA